jgi:hypothetical protein
MRLILAGCALAIVAAGPAFAEPRQHSGFTLVNASAGTDVIVTAGSPFSVDVSGPGAERVITRVSGDTLIIERRTSWFSWGPTQRAEVRVSMPRVEGLSSSSGADLVASAVEANNIALAASSGADLRVSGRCGAFTADASSGGTVRADALQCENGSVEVSSGADAHVFASGRLNVDASSGGSVVVHGNPGLGDVSMSSGGSMRRAN